MAQEENWLLNEKYNGEKSEAFFADCKRLALGEPLAYLIGHTPFLDSRIFLDSHPLIPRVETEHWVKEAIEVIKTQQTNSLGIVETQIKVLDLCAGSGCIGVAVAKNVPNAVVDFSELDKAHLPTIEKNLKENSIGQSRYKIFHSSLFNSLRENKYDFILSNPPYINAELDRTDDDVLNNEPHLALFGGKDGMDIIKEIIETSPNHLKNNGQLWIEHEPEQVQEINTLATKSGFEITNHKDQYKRDRYSILVLK